MPLIARAFAIRPASEVFPRHGQKNPDTVALATICKLGKVDPRHAHPSHQAFSRRGRSPFLQHNIVESGMESLGDYSGLEEESGEQAPCHAIEKEELFID